VLAFWRCRGYQTAKFEDDSALCGEDGTMATIKIDGKDYDTGALSDQAKATYASLLFVKENLQQLHNELAIADTARIAYSAALKRELARSVTD
jgi:hypothetical protein